MSKVFIQRSLRSRRNIAISAAVLGALPAFASKGYGQALTTYSYTPSGQTNTWSGAAGWNAEPVSGSTTDLDFNGVYSTGTDISTNDIQNLFQLNELDLTGAGPAGSGTLLTNNGTMNISGDSLDFVANAGSPAVVNLTATGTFDGSLATGTFNSAQFFVNNNINFAAATTFQGSGTASFDFTGQFSGTGNITKTGVSTLIVGSYLTQNSGINESFTYNGNITVDGGTIALSLDRYTTGYFTSNGFYSNGTLTLNGGTFDTAAAGFAIGYISVGSLNVGSGAFQKDNTDHDALAVDNLVPDNITGISTPQTSNFGVIGPGGMTFGPTSSAGTLGFASGALFAASTGTTTLTADPNTYDAAGIGTVIFTGTGVGSLSPISNTTPILLAGTTDVAPNAADASSMFVVGFDTTAGAAVRLEGEQYIKIDNGGAGTVQLQGGTFSGNASTSAYLQQNTARGVMVVQPAQGLGNLGLSDKFVVLANQNTGTTTDLITTAVPLTNNVTVPWLVAADASASAPTQPGDFLTYVGVGSTTDMGFVTATIAYNGGSGLTVDNGNTFTNYSTSLTSGTSSTNVVEINAGGSATTSNTGTGAFAAYDLRIDNDTLTIPSGGSISINSGTNGIILNGATITGAGTLALGNYPYIYTSLANGTLSSNISGTPYLTKFGPGTLYLAGTGTLTGAGSISGSNSIQIEGGALDVGAMTGGTTATNSGHLPTGNLYLAEGVLEGSGTFSRTLGTSAGSVEFGQAGGFAAAGAPFYINLGGTQAQLTWGAGSFAAAAYAQSTGYNYSNTGGNNSYTDYAPLVFGAPTANNEVNFQNPVALGPSTPFYYRDVYVVAGQGGDFALMSGVISDTAGAIGQHGIVKDGNGTLVFSGANSYAGETAVVDGTLVLDGNAPSGSNGVLGNSTLPVLLGSGSGLPTGLLTGGPIAAGPYTIASNINLQGNGVGVTAIGGSTAEASTYSGAIALNTSVSLTAASGGSVSYSGVISGAGAVTSTGSGITILAGSNTYTGGTTVSTGTLYANSTVGSATGAGSVNVNAGATFGGNGIVTGPVNLASGSTLAAGNGGTAALGTLTLSTLTLGSGTQTLDFRLGNNTVASDMLNVIGANGLTMNGTPASTTINILNLNNVAIGTYTLIDFAGSVQGLGTNSLASYISGLTLADGRLLASLAVDPSGQAIDLDITGGNDTIKWTGATNSDWDIDTTQNWQQVLRGNPTVYEQPTVPGDTVTFDDSATGTTTVNVAAVVSPTSVTFNNSADPYVFNGTGGISGTGTLTKNGSNSVTFNETNTYTGLTTINAGTIIVGATGALGSPGYVVGSAGLVVNGALTGTPTISLTGGTATFNSSATLASVTQTGGAETFNSAATVSLMSVSSGAATFDGTSSLGTMTLTSGAATFNGATSIGAFNADVNSTIYNTQALTATTAASNTSLLAAPISGSGSMNFAGAGTMDLTATNTYTGTTNLGGGTLLLGTASALPASSTVVLTGGVFNTNGYNLSLAGLSGTAAATLSIPSPGQTITVNTSGSNNSYLGAITGSGNLTTTGSGTFTLGGAWTTTGSVGSLTIGGTGTVIIAVGRTGNSTPVTVNSGATLFLATGDGPAVLGENMVPSSIPLTVNGTLDINGDSTGYNGAGPWGGPLQGSGTLTDSNTSTIAAFDNTSDSPTTFSGTIQGDLRFTRRGNSTGAVLTLSGTNTYIGETEIRGTGALMAGDSGNNYGSTIAISSDVNLGAATVTSLQNTLFGYALGGPNVVWLGNNVTGSGEQGTLEVTGNSDTSTNRQILLDKGGGGIDVASATNVFTLYGPVTIAANNAYYSGGAGTTGTFIKSGPGTLVLDNTDTYPEATTSSPETGVDDYNGPTDVVAGTLSVADQLTASTTITVDATSYASNLVLNAADALSSSASVTGIAGSSTLPNIISNYGQTFSSVNNPGTTDFSAGASTLSTVAGTGTLLVGSTAALNVTGSLNQTEVLSNGALSVSAGTNVVGIGNGVGTGAGGTLTTGGIDGSGTLSVSTSSLTAAHIRQGVLNIDGASTVTIADSSAPGNTAATSVLTDLNNSGTLDLKNNDMIINDPAQNATIVAEIANAYDGGAWDKSGITSSNAAANLSYGLGYATAAQLGTTSFDGQPVASGATLVKYTLLGDTTLKGSVSLGDYNTVVNNFGNSGATWVTGDFQHTGVVSLADYNDVVNNFGLTASVVSSNLAAPRSVSPSLHLASVVAGAVSPAVVSASDVHLEVNVTTGDVELEDFTAGNTSVLSGYEITSASGSLVPFPTQQFNIGTPKNPNYITVVEGNSLSYNESNYTTISNKSTNIAEGQTVSAPQDSNPLAPGDTSGNQVAPGTYDLGDIFAGLSGVEDLSFQWSGAGGTTTYTDAPVDYLGGTPTPEPAALGVLGLGGVMMMRRRRRSYSVTHGV